jgi:hypothetical protein
VVTVVRRACLLASLSFIASIPAFAANWTQPTPDELKMTSDPAAPDAPAIYLFREEIVDDRTHFHRLYARVKILTEKGKEEYSDIEMPYEAGVSNIRAIEGRTIHPDGSVVVFSGKPYTKELVKTGDTKIMAKVFSMPDVQVGSILEYRYELQYDDHTVSSPEWYIQQPVFVHKAHYHFVPTTFELGELTSKDAFGKEKTASRLLWFPWLPPGYKVREGMDGYDLVVDNIPALPDEEYSPPLQSYSYRLIFYYSSTYTGADYWKGIGKEWSKDVDRFANPSDRIRQAVAGIVAPGDTDDQKLEKIYKAVMTLENTRFTREHSDAENKAQGLRIKTAADIWEQKRGSDDEITRLFIAMAKAAGMKAYAVAVTERNKNLLNLGYLDWTQLEDEIAIVNAGGKEVYLDPGQRYCEYGRLHWMHTGLQAVRQIDGGAVALITTPGQTYVENQVIRVADLELGPDGTLKGMVRVGMSGADALRWRQAALRGDEQEVKKDFEMWLQNRVPDGVHVVLDHFINLTDNEAQLMAVAKITGSLGTQTGKRILLPSGFFEAKAKPLFAQQKRENAVDLLYPYLTKDQVTIKMAPSLAIESVPTNTDIPMGQLAMYKVNYKSSNNTYVQVRQLALGTPLYKADEYPQLRDFFQKSSAQDQQQLILKRSATEASAAGAPAKSE